MSRMYVPLLTMLALAAAPAAARAEDTPKDILTRAVKAHGGEEFLNKYPGARAQNKGKITLPGLGEAEFTQSIVYLLPGKFRDVMELSIAGQSIKIVTIKNGETISITAMDKDVPITDDIKKSVADALYMMSMSRLTPLLKDKGYELSLFGDTKVEEKPAVGVRISRKGKNDVTLFFDKKTDLLVKIESRMTDPNTGAEVAEERTILEYRKDKDGRSLPKKVQVKRDGKTFLEAESSEFEFLEKVDDSEFKK